MLNIARIAQTRYTTKAFDKSRRIPDEQVEQIAALLRLSPSSTNAQPWHFVLAGTEEGKARIAKSTTGLFAFNGAKIMNASHVVVLCARASIDACPMEGFDQKVLDEELGLRAQGLTSSLIVALGYRSPDDFNAKLPKSRLPETQILTRI